MLNIQNPSNFYSYQHNNLTYYSPNEYIIKLMQQHPNYTNWAEIYTEFAIVIINQQTGQINLIRDHLGVEPLFYYYQDSTLIFASNIPDILKQQRLLSLNIKHLEDSLLQLFYPYAKLYDQTTSYHNIYRVLAGTIHTLEPKHSSYTYFWDLQNNPIQSNITLEDATTEFEYQLNQGIKLMTQNSQNLACEFSGGIDSSTIVTSLHQQNIQSQLYIHGTPDNSNCEPSDHMHVLQVLKEFNLEDKAHFIDASGYNLANVSQLMAQLFAGYPEYPFVNFANNIHQSISQNQHDIVLSGFGGDECISSHATLSLVLHELITQYKFSDYINELTKSYNYIHKKPNYLRYIMSNILRSLNPRLINYLISKYKYRRKITNYYLEDYNCVHDKEASLITGALSHHVKLRIEDSSIIGKHYGFKYYYPLLYPPLVEFCNSLPLKFKRQDGVNRFLVRQYLAKHLPPDVYNKHQKIGGITPATFYQIQHNYMNNKYTDLFNNLPHTVIRDKINAKFGNGHLLRQNILLLTLNNYLNKDVL